MWWVGWLLQAPIVQCNRELTTAVRKELAVALRDLLQHGLMEVGMYFTRCKVFRHSSLHSRDTMCSLLLCTSVFDMAARGWRGGPSVERFLTPRCTNSFRCTHEYLVVGSGGYLCMCSLCTVIAVWLTVSHRSQWCLIGKPKDQMLCIIYFI